MTLHVNDAGTWKQAIPYVNDAGTWKAIKELWVNDVGTWKKAYSAFSVSVSPTALSTSASTSTITSASATATPAGGTGPYTYAWSFTDNPGGLTIVTASAATTTVRKTGSVLGDPPYTATLICTVTDTATGSTAVSNSVPVTLTRT